MDHRLTDADTACGFIAAGNATFTVVSIASGTRFTYKVKAPRKNGSFDTEAGIRFVSLLTGSDNEGDYSYIGFLKGGRFIYGGRKAKAGRDAPGVAAFTWLHKVLDGPFADRHLTESVELYHKGHCGACGRTLTVPASILSGLGPICAGARERAAA